MNPFSSQNEFIFRPNEFIFMQKLINFQAKMHTTFPPSQIPHFGPGEDPFSSPTRPSFVIRPGENPSAIPLRTGPRGR